MSWTLPLLKGEYLKDFQLDIYEREVERYGGAELIELSEEFFCKDSELCLDLLKTAGHPSSKMPIYVIAAISLVDLLEGLGEKTEKIPSYLTSELDKRDLIGIRPWSKTLTSLNHEALGISQALMKRQEIVPQLRQRMYETQQKRALPSSLASMQNSLIHMHCNRLMGIDPGLERTARLYTQYAIEKRINTGARW